MSSIHVLLVEDNEGDIILTTETLQELNIDVRLSIVTDGQRAINFLREHLRNFDPQESIDLVLLDVNLPKKNGFEVLEFLKTNPDCKQMPVIMLTTSSSVRDINLSQQCAAYSYLIKPLEANALKAILGTFENRQILNNIIQSKAC